MVHATPDPRSNRSEDTQTLSAAPQASQAAQREAYIESILADWPAPTPRQERTIGSLLGNGTAWLSEKQYQSWEIKRHIQTTETPGIHGSYGDEVAA